MKFFIAICSLLFIFFITFCGNIQAEVPAYLLKAHEEWMIFPDDSLIQLQHSFILAGSDSVRNDNKILERNTDYTIDYQKGELRIFYHHAVSESLFIWYRYLPINLRPSYRFMPYVQWQDANQDTTVQSVNRTSADKPVSNQALTDSQLRKSGSITRSVTVGSNQGLRLDSGLRLQLEGKITSDVNVVAALSDQNTPIQPEGNTQTLQEIDKVYIQIQSPYLQATLGDFHIGYDGGRFGNYQRKLQGASLSFNRGSIKGTVAGAVSRGKFTTNRFSGVEGKQGPYQLRGENGQSEIIILAGTEHVWVDGEAMVRGEENDYVIEYGSGQVTFTRNRLITGDSRIIVDFEYSDLQFQRNLYSGHFSGTGWNDRVTFNATFINESDDRNNPIEASISDQEKQLLSSIGDRLDDAYIESGHFVGAGKGNYVQIDSASSSFYRYVGQNLGDYQVSFSYVGNNSGEYSYMGGGRYQYVGPNSGNYTPRRYLPVAQGQNLASFFMQTKPALFLNLSGEIAVSRLDYNLWSSLDDQNNWGTAYQLQANFAPEALKIKQTNFGKLQLSGLLRQQGSRFHEITRNREVEYNRKWDLQNESINGEKVYELNSNYSPWNGVQLRSNLGEIKKGALFRSNRKEAEFVLRRPKFPEIAYREENIQRSDNQTQISGDWIRRLGTFQYRLWRLTPRLRYEHENKQDRSFSDSLRTGFSFDDITAGLGIRIANPLELTFAQTQRNDSQVFDQRMQDYSTAYSQQYGIRLSQWHNLQFNFSYTNRVRRYNQQIQPETRTRLADMNIAYSPLQRAFHSDVRLQMSTTQTSKLEEFYFKVDEGNGSYRFDPDLNEYVPDPFGTYILRTLATGEFEPVNDLLINGKISFKPRLLWLRAKEKPTGLKGWLSSFAAETYFSMNEKSSRQNPWELNFGSSGLLFPDQETVLGRYTVRQDFYFFENTSDRSLRFRWLENYEKNNRLTTGSQYSLRQEQSVRFNSRLSRKFSLQVNMAQQRIDRIFASALRVNRKILSRGGDVRLSYRPQSHLEIAADMKLLRDMDQAYSPSTKTTLMGMKPGFSYAFRGRGRLRGEFEFSSVTAIPGDRIIPYEMAEGRRVGKNYRWQLGLDYRLSSRIMILVNYLGRREPGRDDVQHLGKAEVKAFF